MLGVAALALTAGLPAFAAAKTYSDVPKSHWAYAAIKTVTERGPAQQRLLDDYGDVFRPDRAIVRAEMARALVIAAGVQASDFAPVEISDVSASHPYYAFIQRALKFKLMGLDKEKRFLPNKTVTAASAETLLVRWLKRRHPTYTWKLLTNLSPGRWEPNESWRVKAPAYLPSVVASRQLQLRVNHSAASDHLEVTPGEAVSRAEVASMFERGYSVASTWHLYGLADFAVISFPELSARQREIATFALKYVGYPYVWGGEYPTENSPYGRQEAGGFDCSGFAFYVMKMRFGYPLTLSERGGGAMAKVAKPRIARQKLTGGDLIFFGTRGPKSAIADIYHVGLYLGNGWFIHSTGSSDGVTLASLEASSYWRKYFAWGRRLLSADELATPEPSST